MVFGLLCFRQGGLKQSAFYMREGLEGSHHLEPQQELAKFGSVNNMTVWTWNGVISNCCSVGNDSLELSGVL